MLELLAPFLVGLAGSLHCVGMCGPIVLAFSLQAPPSGTGMTAVRVSLGHHLAFHGGRILSYMFLGGVAGVVAHLVNLQMFMGHLRATVSLLGGMALLLMGLVLLRLIPLPSWAQPTSGSSPWVSRFLGSRSLSGRMALGVATGFLPCMLPWAMMIKAASSGGMVEALSTMALFGLGTVPALLALGVSATAISTRARLLGERVAAIGVMFMGAVLCYKGGRALLRLHGLLG